MARRTRKNKQDVQASPGVVMTKAEPEEAVTEQPAPEAEKQEESTVEQVVAQAMEETAPEAEPPKEEAPLPPPDPAPAVIRQFRVPKKQVMSEDLYPTKINPMLKCTMSPAQLHTAPGLKLIEMFNEYEAAMSVRTKDHKENERRFKMLSAIVQQTCPYKLKNPQVGKDLVSIFFDRLMKGWGTIYTDNTIFRLDYTLNNPIAIDKTDIFVGAMIQLVEAASGESDHIAFVNDRLAKVIDSPAVMTAIENLRVGIEKRILQQSRK